MQSFSFEQATTAIIQHLRQSMPKSTRIQNWLEDILWQGFPGLVYALPEMLEDEYETLTGEKIRVGPRPTPLEPTPRSINEAEHQKIQEILSKNWRNQQPWSLDQATMWAIEQHHCHIYFLAIPGNPSAPLVIHNQSTNHWYLTTLLPTSPSTHRPSSPQRHKPKKDRHPYAPLR